MADQYLHFTYAGVHSSVFNTFYRNDGDDLVYPFLPQFSQEILSPMFQRTTYHLGTQYGQSTYNLRLAVDRLTNTELRAVTSWLNIEEANYITFDAFPHYKQKVIVTSIGDMTLYPIELRNGEIKNLMMFDVQFSSVGDPYPMLKERLNNAGEVNIIEPETKLPILEKSEGKWYFYNFTRLPQSLILEKNNSSLYNIKLEGKTFYENTNTIPSLSKIKINTAYGIVEATVGTQTSFIESFLQENQTVTNAGPLLIPSGLIYHGILKGVSFNGNGDILNKSLVVLTASHLGVVVPTGSDIFLIEKTPEKEGTLRDKTPYRGTYNTTFNIPSLKNVLNKDFEIYVVQKKELSLDTTTVYLDFKNII